MYFAIFHFHGCKVGTAQTLNGTTTARNAVAAAVGMIANNNSKEQAQRTPRGNWLECAFIYNATGEVVAMIEQQPNQPQPKIAMR